MHIPQQRHCGGAGWRLLPVPSRVYCDLECRRASNVCNVRKRPRTFTENTASTCEAQCNATRCTQSYTHPHSLKEHFGCLLRTLENRGAGAGLRQHVYALRVSTA